MKGDKMSYFYRTDVGKTVKIIREPPYKEYGVCVGDIGIITYVASTNKCSVYIPNKKNPHEDKNRKYGNPGDFWIPFECLEKYNFKIGDRVIVVTSQSKNKGKIGTVTNNKVGYYNHHIGVLLDDYEHRKNTKYDLKLCSTSIRLINCNETNIEREENIMKLTGYNKVAVIEMGSTNYHFALYDDDIQVGDRVLVTGNCNILTIKEIITKDEAKERYPKDITSEVMCKVDLSAYETRLENRKKAEKLKKEMDKKIAEMDEMNKYVLYAEKNEDLAKMLAEYRELV